MNRWTAGLATLAAAATLTACSPGQSESSAQQQGQAQTEVAFGQQSKTVPYPVAELRDSLERRNIRERLLRTNKSDSIGYVYLMSFGKVIGYYVIKGKVTSTQSQMTTSQLVQGCGSGTSYSCAVTVPAPGDDGSYGANEPGIFFFTQSGQMVTTSLDYIWSDALLPVDVPRFGK